MPSQTGTPDRGHQQCQAIPDQHALDTLVSSITLPAWLDGQAAQTLHQSAAAVQAVGDLADIDAKTAKLLATLLQPFLSIGILLMVVRIVLSWYPQIPGNKMPWAVAYKPTEPILGPTRNLIKPVGGVDISPIIWVAILSFINEILLGPQGILNLLQRKIDLP
ncbi:hypothetical protein CVIRNUC_006493 [Coccomyxa viridis]|uniref:YggT family protein n=1 Tax=Coccomyxa viridis TaxID=1274662 RepID=A0AAV1I8B7_9CHLO|nr:hypothetical protein CVIRNUC_006493 [Coccomyxa viridis]